MLVPTSTKGALVRLCYYSGLLYGHPGDCVGTVEYYRSSRAALLVQKSTNGALMEQSGDVLVQQTTIL